MKRLVLVLSLFAAGCGGSPERERPDVVVILIDTLRPDHLGFGGYERETAPFLAELASGATVFERAFSSSSWTAPSTASLFTSLYPAQHGVVEGFILQRNRTTEVAEPGSASMTLRRLPGALRTLPERMQDAGYLTFGVTANINIGPELGFDRGFHRFERLHGALKTDVATVEDVHAKLLEWERDLRDPGGPKFVYLHLNDVHGPYGEHAPWFDPESEGLERTISAYDSGISYLDQRLRRLFEHFGWEREALVVVLSDHGEELGDHGEVGHGFSLHRELTQILMLARPPGGGPARRVRENVSIVDLMPTILELVGAPAPEASSGTSLAPLIEARPEASAEALRRTLGERVILSHRESKGRDSRVMWSANRDGWRLIRLRRNVSLYDIDADPAERVDLAGEQATLVQDLVERMRASHARGPRFEGDETRIEIDPATVEALKALGYVGDDEPDRPRDH